MTLDLAVAVAVLVFALLGAMSGFAQQVAQAAAAAAALLAASPTGKALGPLAAKQLSASLTTGVVVATVLAFLVIYFAVRLTLTALLRRLLAGKDPTNRGADRLLGALLGGGKAGGLAYLGLCAVLFLENNLVVAGKRYTLTPKDSALVPLARRYNVLERLQFSGTGELAHALKLARDPKAAARLQGDQNFGALLKDPRFKALLSQKGVQQALESGDVRALLAHNQVVELIQDGAVRDRLSALEASEREER